MGAVDEAPVDLLKRSTSFWNEPCVDLVEPQLASIASCWALTPTRANGLPLQVGPAEVPLRIVALW